jgi:hypothetical protein
MAQCKSVISSDMEFTTPNLVVPGQYALAAIDGSNATAWQPVSIVCVSLTYSTLLTNEQNSL